MDLYLFDFDETLYDYNFRHRLPALSVVTGVSQYHLARTWWAAGFERRAEAGEWPTSREYLEKFAEVTGAALTLEQWRETRMLASTPIPASIAVLRYAATLGAVAVLTNNPSPFEESLSVLAPDVAGIVHDGLLVSGCLGVRKPDAGIYQLAMQRFGAEPHDTFFTDDSSANVLGARDLGITAHQIQWVNQVPQVEDLRTAITDFSARSNDWLPNG